MKTRTGSAVVGHERLGPSVGVGHDDLGPVLVSEGGDVPADQGVILPVPLDEDRPGRPPAQGLQAEGAGAGEEVEREEALDRVAEDIEDRLADQVAGRAGARSPGPSNLWPRRWPAMIRIGVRLR